MTLEDGTDEAGRGELVVACELVRESPAVEALEDLGLIHGALDRAPRQDGGEVEDRAGDGGDRDAVDGRDVRRC